MYSLHIIIIGRTLKLVYTYVRYMTKIAPISFDTNDRKTGAYVNILIDGVYSFTKGNFPLDLTRSQVMRAFCHVTSFCVARN